MIKARFYTSFLTRTDGVKWSSADYGGKKCVDAIKGKPINGYAYVPNGTGGMLRLEESSRAAMAGVFGAWARQQLVSWFGAGTEVALIPIPGSSSVAPSATFVAQGLATAVTAGSCPVRATVQDVVRFTSPMVPSHAGGSRDPDYLCAHMTLLGGVVGVPVLIDDVFTLGAHVKAVAKLFSQHSLPAVGHALCVAETVHESQTNAFERPERLVAPSTNVSIGDWDL